MARSTKQLLRPAAIREALHVLAPRLPAFESGAVTDRALLSRGLAHAVPSEAAWLALVAYVRHVMTEYDDLLEDGYDVDSARFFVREAMATILAGWGVRRPLVGDEGMVDPSGARS